MSGKLFTIGHSTHSIAEFLALLTQQGIKALADIRRFPGSKRFPHFNREHLASSLRDAGIEYHWMEALGGRRSKADGDSINLGLRNESFRNYADYMGTVAFQHAVNQLVTLAADKPTAMMCSESVFWRCHRRLVSDYLQANGKAVQHIMPTGKMQPHSLTDGARVEDGHVTYPRPSAGKNRLLF